MDYNIRHATVDDGEGLLELWHGFTDHLAGFDDRYEHNESADDRWLSYFENQLVDSKYGTVIVAEHDGDLVGILEARITGNHPIFRLENHGHVYGHYVQDRIHGEGVGKELLEAAEEWFLDPAREVNFYRINVIEGDKNASEIYESYGLRAVEHTFEKQLK
jgi:GNAT superfamily N-acetyltransferase